jgi:F0F1-type ATP synthase assembly protein I
MCETLKNRIETDTSANTDELQKSILFLSLILTVIIVLISFASGEGRIAKGFLMGAGISLVYFRMQVLFVKNFAKRDLLSILISILSGGRILIIAAVLFIAVRRVDLFNLTATIAGLVSVHLISFIVFSYNAFKNDKKKLIMN